MIKQLIRTLKQLVAGTEKIPPTHTRCDKCGGKYYDMYVKKFNSLNVCIKCLEQGELSFLNKL